MSTAAELEVPCDVRKKAQPVVIEVVTAAHEHQRQPLASVPVSRVGTATDESAIFTHQSSTESQNTTTTNSNGHLDDGEEEGDKEEEEEEEELHEQDPLNTSNSFLHAPEVTQSAQPEVQVQPQQQQTQQSVFRDCNEAREIVDINQLETTLSRHSNKSYLQDADEQLILLNTHIRRRRSTRSARPTSSIRDPVLHEVEKLRQKSLKEEKKKQRSFLDDDRVLVGKKVSEGHQNYVIAYNMLTGIRVAVSRCSGVPKPITETDFQQIQKLRFDSSGNELTPSSKYDFKFKDYAPTVFRELRRLFGLDPADYLVSLTSKYILSELNSPGKSGSFFYYSRDYRFIIKTIHYSEHRHLRKILKLYYEHVKHNPNTMLSQFYGLHRVKMPIYYGRHRRIYFIVMNNLFPPHRDLSKVYDLKGSTMGRYTFPKSGNTQEVLKDLNWLQEEEVIRFGPLKHKIFVDQLRKDVELLIKMSIMDYSFLIGFHDLSKVQDDGTVKRKKLSVFSPVSSNLSDLKNTNPKLLRDLKDLPQIDYHHTNVFYIDEGGINATSTLDEPLDQVYYFGIIDCLTNYSLKKRLETVWRSLSNDRRTISALPPSEYGRRFIAFVEDSINENTAGEDKSESEEQKKGK